MTDSLPLATLLLARLESVDAASVAAPELEQVLHDRLLSAAQAWPTVSVSHELFVPYLAERLVDGEPLLSSLLALHVEDLYLACSCALGDARAIAAFERHIFPDVKKALARMDGAAAEDDVAQMVRQKLFVKAGEAPPRIVEYSGRGSLRSWFRVVVVRAALSAAKKHAREVPTDDETLFDLPTTSVELQHLKNTYRTEFKRAFGQAFEELGAHERNLLRQHFEDGLSIDQLGALHGVHRATAARWLTRVRDTLREKTLAHLRRRLQVSPAELASIMGLIDSHLEASIHRLLDET